MCYVLPVIVQYKLLRHRQAQTLLWRQRQKEQHFQVGMHRWLWLLMCMI